MIVNFFDMYVQIVILGTLFLPFISSDVSTKTEESTVREYDDFIPLTSFIAKDEFDWKLIKKFASRNYKNVIISPVSLKLVLALLYEGASRVTEKEFQKVLDFPADKNLLRRNFSELLDVLVVNRSSYIINTETQLFLDHYLNPSLPYQAIADQYYHARITKLNFSNSVDASSKINNWVHFLTNGRIKQFVQQEDIEHAVSLVANVLYFKGLWLVPFPENETFTGGYHTTPTEIINVDYMQITDRFFYFDSKRLNAQILRLPYKGLKFSMYILLPYSKNGLSELMEHLDTDGLNMGAKFMDQTLVKVILPKFRFDFQAKYAEILREFGFDTVFQGISSFPGIVTNKDAQLVITDILQKSGIDVNEEGSIIYSTSQVTLGNKHGGHESVTIFNASHPFLFFIHEKTTNKIMFIGKVENPLDTDATPLSDRYGSFAEPTKASLTETNQSSRPVALSHGVSPSFDINFLKNAMGTSKNVFVSPASIKISLAMIGEAADRDTQKGIYRALGIRFDERHQLMTSLINELNEESSGSIVKSQNVIFVSDKERVLPQYANNVKTHYRASVVPVNYYDPSSASVNINSFVNDATGGLIRKVVSPGEIDQTTRVMLTNVLYFKASWQKTFDKSLTKQGWFHASAGRPVPVQFMHTIDTFNYTRTAHAYVISLSYTGNSRAMLLVIPRDNNDLKSALYDVETPGFSTLVDSLIPTEIELILPKFDLDYGQDIIQILEKLNIKNIFESNSNLPNLLEGNSPSAINHFIHKTKIEVTEEGTEAAAVSLVSVIPLMGNSNPKIKADHPFAFFLYNTKSHNILFEGILNEPQPNLVLETKSGDFPSKTYEVPQQNQQRTQQQSQQSVQNQQQQSYSGIGSYTQDQQQRYREDYSSYQPEYNLQQQQRQTNY